MTIDEIKAARNALVSSFNGQFPDWFTGAGVSREDDGYGQASFVLRVNVLNNDGIALAEQYLTDNNISVPHDIRVTGVIRAL